MNKIMSVLLPRELINMKLLILLTRICFPGDKDGGVTDTDNEEDKLSIASEQDSWS